MVHLTRRRALAGLTVGATALLAGCLGDDGPEEPPANGYSVGLLVNVDEEAFLAIQQAVMEEVEEGELAEEEAQREMIERQLDLLETHVDDLVDHVESDTDLVVIEAMPQTGIVLVEGDADEILLALESEHVSGVLPAEDVEPAEPPA